MKKLEVNKDMCISCGTCFSIDTEHFAEDDDGLSEVISQENLDTELVKNVVDSCPTRAISLNECCCGECNCGDNK